MRSPKQDSSLDCHKYCSLLLSRFRGNGPELWVTGGGESWFDSWAFNWLVELWSQRAITWTWLDSRVFVTVKVLDSDWMLILKTETYSSSSWDDIRSQTAHSWIPQLHQDDTSSVTSCFQTNTCHLDSNISLPFIDLLPWWLHYQSHSEWRTLIGCCRTEPHDELNQTWGFVLRLLVPVTMILN